MALTSSAVHVKHWRHEPAVATQRQSCLEAPEPLGVRISTAQLYALTRQLAVLLRAGMPLADALRTLREQFSTLQGRPAVCRKGRDGLLPRMIGDIEQRLTAGVSFAQALSNYPEVFGPVYVNLVAAGEASGALEQVLFRLAEMLQRRSRIAGKVKAALAYPLVMCAVAVAVVALLLSVIVPSVTQLLVEMRLPLPMPTRVLIGACDFVRSYGLAAAALALVATVLLAGWIRTKRGRCAWDRFLLGLPVIGELFLKRECERFARTLAVLLSSGVAVLEALKTAEAVLDSTIIRQAVAAARGRVAKGQSLAEALQRSQAFPPVLVHLVATGQASGTLEQALTEIAEMYDHQIELQTKALTSLLEPAVLVVMGVVVGFIVLAVLLPIFQMNQVL